MPLGQRIARTLSLRSLLRLLQHAALLVATAALVGFLVGQTLLEALRSRAEQGYAFAQFNLGVMYNDGQGVPQDYAEAVKWYRLAAEQGDASAQYNLGLMYWKGEGVPQDYVEAHRWFNLAASRVTGEDSNRFRKPRDLVAKKMTSAQIAEAQRLAREWKPKTWEELKGQVTQ